MPTPLSPFVALLFLLETTACSAQDPAAGEAPAGPVPTVEENDGPDSGQDADHADEDANDHAVSRIPRVDGQLVLPSEAELAALPPDGGPLYNRLIFAHSPYLLQHAMNPVDWHEWGDAAFLLAAERDVPVLLSIGYSTCHWCHVMEHESFEDPEVAALLNANFVCVKVDREERPDIDTLHMSVVQLATGRGGWPMTLILTPEREPILAATYIPRESRDGRMGMLDLIPAVALAWAEDRDQLVATATQVVAQLRADQASHATDQVLGLDTVASAVAQLRASYDPVNGGYGRAPKFPVPHNLRLLLWQGVEHGDQELLDQVRHTLVSMRRGGVWDHVGHGFHRYSTDARWFLPHFEKMLYDQALCCLAYTDAALALGEPAFERTAREICEYVLRDLRAPGGGFFSAEDADSEGEEGLFYLWRPEEIVEVLGAVDGARVNEWFGVREGGNFQEEASGASTGESHLFLERDFDDDERVLWANWRAQLFAAREDRVHPLRDDKVLTDWNGLMIAALARAGAAFDEPRFVEAALEAARFVESELRDPGTGALLKRWRAGRAGLPALLEDHAFLALGHLELYAATSDPTWLVAARREVDAAIAHHWDAENGGFFIARDDADDLFVRGKEVYDGALPSGNSVLADVLVRLGRLTGDTDLEDRARQTFAALGAPVLRYPGGHSWLLRAVRRASGQTFELVVVGDPKATEPVLARLRGLYLPQVSVLLRSSTGSDRELLDALAPFTSAMEPLADGLGLYLCTEQTCDAPTADLEAVLERLSHSGSQDPAPPSTAPPTAAPPTAAPPTAEPPTAEPPPRGPVSEGPASGGG